MVDILITWLQQWLTTWLPYPIDIAVAGAVNYMLPLACVVWLIFLFFYISTRRRKAV